MMLFKVALRNILRNRRRSGMTVAAIAVGAIAMLIFGAFTTFVILGVRTTTVQAIGHLVVLRTGYFSFGSGNPAAYGIPDYRNVMKEISDDPTVGPMISVITPSVSLFGIAGNFALVLLDHAQNGFFSGTEWLAVGTAAFLAYPPARVLGANDRVRVGIIGADSVCTERHAGCARRNQLDTSRFNPERRPGM